MLTEKTEGMGALKPQPSKKRRKRLREFKHLKGIMRFIEELKSYGLDCVEWKDAKPFSTVLEFLAVICNFVPPKFRKLKAPEIGKVK